MPPPKVQDMFQVVFIDDAVAEREHVESYQLSRVLLTPIEFPEGSTLLSAKPHGAGLELLLLTCNWQTKQFVGNL